MLRHYRHDQVGEQGCSPVPGSGPGELVALIRDLNQQVLELSGRCGYYQAKLQEAEARILELSAPDPVSDPTPSDPVPAATQQTPPRRPTPGFGL